MHSSKVLMGFALTYLQAFQDSLNKLQHIITGNPRLLLLDQLIPEQRQTISLENLLQEQEETNTYTRDYLLSFRPPKETLDAPLLPLANNRLLLPRKRKGHRIQIQTATQDRIFAKTQNKSNNRIRRQSSSLTTPHRHRNRRDKGIHLIHRINSEVSQRRRHAARRVPLQRLTKSARPNPLITAPFQAGAPGFYVDVSIGNGVALVGSLYDHYAWAR